MEVNFPLLLVVATLVTGGIWLLDLVWWRPARRAAALAGDADSAPAMTGDAASGAPATARQAAPPKEPLVVEYARSFFPIILAVLLLRSFIVEPFRIPSGSMLPTLLIGDFILVNKFSYGLRLPVLNAKVVDIGLPERGDVVVFRYPRDPSIDYIKRVVGLPGDRVAYLDKTIYVNGQPVTQRRVGNDAGTQCGFGAQSAERRVESLGEVSHAILVCPRQPSVEGEYRVPDGHYFVMGDNRDNSNDSRFWGTVPEENLVGKAFLIWLNVGEWGRIGDSIR